MRKFQTFLKKYTNYQNCEHLTNELSRCCSFYFQTSLNLLCPPIQNEETQQLMLLDLDSLILSRIYVKSQHQNITMTSVYLASLLLILNLKREIQFPRSFSVSFFKLIEQNSGVYSKFRQTSKIEISFSSIGSVIADTGKKGYSFVSSGKYTCRMDRISKRKIRACIRQG